MKVLLWIKKNKWLMAALIILLLVFVLFGHYKAYLYEDEVLSYTAANSREGMRPKLQMNTITDGGEFVKKAVTVGEHSRFDFANAVHNTSTDPHPPLYLLLLHFICSLAPGVFSKWSARINNQFFSALTVLFLYKSSVLLYPLPEAASEPVSTGPDKVAKDGLSTASVSQKAPAVAENSPAEAFGGIVSIAYCLSLGFITQLMNLRMYVMLQAFTAGLTLQYILLFRKERDLLSDSSLTAGAAGNKGLFDVKRAVLFTVNIFLGTMTHYYFLIFAFFEAAFFTSYLLKNVTMRRFGTHSIPKRGGTEKLLNNKDFADIFKHIGIYALSGILVLISFPAIIWQITGSDVGSESFLGRNPLELLRRMRAMLSLANGELCGGQLLFLLIFLIAFAMFCLYEKLKARNLITQDKTRGASIKAAVLDCCKKLAAYLNIEGFFLIFTSLCYFLTVSCTTPYLTSRYLSPAYPIYIMLIFIALIPIVRRLFRSEFAGLIAVLIIFAIPFYGKIRAGLFDVNKAAMQSLSKEHSEALCIFFSGIPTEENYFELENYKRLMAMRLKQKSKENKGDALAIADESEVVIYVPEGGEPEEYFERIREINPYLTEDERLYRAYYSDAYLLSRPSGTGEME
ncbi:MAG: hypothetical protein J6O55_03675 [Lachnospiraceae bacterium]|nr:hypothetical protein [Lachnospiraceae bacterium]